MGIRWHRNRNLSKDEYLMNFNESVKPAQTEKDSKIENAYRQAAEIRKFEIELFWKRAGYFWAFIVSIYAAFFNVQKEFYYDKYTGFKHGTIPLLSLSALRFFFCLAWLLSSYASKFWQENWENHIDLLEDYVTGPLHKIYSAGKSFSFSKINITAGYVVSFFSAGLFVFELVEFCRNLKLNHFLIFLVLIVLFACGVSGFIFQVKGNNSDKGEIHFDKKIYEEN